MDRPMYLFQHWQCKRVLVLTKLPACADLQAVDFLYLRKRESYGKTNVEKPKGVRRWAEERGF